MIEAELIFPPVAKRQVLETLMHLLDDLKPERMSIGEDEPGSVVSSDAKSLNSLASRKSSFFLKNRNCSYDINIVCDLPIKLSCFIDAPLANVQIILTRLAASDPLFGFACLPEELEAKNRVVNSIGVNKIESWVGRDINKYLPGLYWWTLIPSSLAAHHGIPLATLVGIAREHTEMPSALHLFRFFDRPEDWKEAVEVQELTADLPGIFDVEKARDSMAQAKTFLELTSISRQWK